MCMQHACKKSACMLYIIIMILTCLRTLFITAIPIHISDFYEMPNLQYTNNIHARVSNVNTSCIHRYCSYNIRGRSYNIYDTAYRNCLVGSSNTLVVESTHPPLALVLFAVVAISIIRPGRSCRAQWRYPMNVLLPVAVLLFCGVCSRLCNGERDCPIRQGTIIGVVIMMY